MEVPEEDPVGLLEVPFFGLGRPTLYALRLVLVVEDSILCSAGEEAFQCHQQFELQLFEWQATSLHRLDLSEVG